MRSGDRPGLQSLTSPQASRVLKDLAVGVGRHSPVSGRVWARQCNLECNEKTAPERPKKKACLSDGVEVEYTSTSVPVGQLDSALHRDRNLTLRFGERLLTATSPAAPLETSNRQHRRY
jgi:hypothetical protein